MGTSRNGVVPSSCVVFLIAFVVWVFLVKSNDCCGVPGSSEPCPPTGGTSVAENITASSDWRQKLMRDRFLRQLGFPNSVPSKHSKRKRIPTGILEALWKETQETYEVDELAPNTELRKVIIHAKRVSGKSCRACVHFSLNKSLNRQEVTRADLWIYMDHSKHCDEKKRNLLRLYKINKLSGGKTYLGQYEMHITVCGWHKVELDHFTNWTSVLPTSANLFTIDILMQIVCVDCVVGMQQHVLPYIGLNIETEVKQRTRRDTVCKPDGLACCIEDLHINITDIVKQSGVVIMPKTVNVGMCRGTCDSVHAASHIRGGLVNAVNLATTKDQRKLLCCAPIKYKSLTTLISVGHSSVLAKSMHDIIVTECGCV